MDTKDKAQLTAKIIKDSLVFSYMPNPSDLIRRSPRGLKVFDDMLSDSRIVGLFYDRRNATQNLAMSITDTGNAQIDRYIEEHLNEKRLRKLSSYLLTDALKYGFRPAEIIWDKRKDWHCVDALIGHDINRYRFSSDGSMTYLGTYGYIPCDHPYKWIIHRTEGDRYNNPWGLPYMQAAYWPWQFKRMGWEFWLTATERFAVPSLIALFEQSDPSKAKDVANELVDLIAQINSGSSGALANTKAVEKISMEGQVSDFDALIKACDLQISYAMTAQALANSMSDTGTQALGTVHEDTKMAFYENDSRALAYTMQYLIDMAIEVNFGPDAPVPTFAYDTGDYAPFANVMAAVDHGVPISRSSLYKRYNLPEPKDEDDTYLKPADPYAAMPGMGGYGLSAYSTPEVLEPKESAQIEPIKQVVAPLPEEQEGAAIAETGAGVTLNGAQVQAATGIVKSVEAGELPRDAGLGQLKILFNLTDSQASEMMGSAGKNPKPKGDQEFADTTDGKKKVRRMLLIES